MAHITGQPSLVAPGRGGLERAVIVPDRCDLCGRRVGADPAPAYGWIPNPLLPGGRMTVLACRPEHMSTIVDRYTGRAAAAVEGDQVHRIRAAFRRDGSVDYTDLGRRAGLSVAEVDQVMELWVRHLERLCLLVQAHRCPARTPAADAARRRQ